ncbi:MAG: hypothetical protein ACRD6R_11770 [Candidatus Polarisedimenticolia bacterium]
MKHLRWILPIAGALLLVAGMVLVTGTQTVADSDVQAATDLQMTVDGMTELEPVAPCRHCLHCPIGNPNCCGQNCALDNCPGGCN